MTTKKLKNESVTEPVRLEFDRLPNDGTFEGIVQRGRNIWLVAPLSGDKRTGNVKVEREKDGRWTCGCKGWQKARYVDCKHISRVRFMIGDGGAFPYDGRRRRLATKILYADGPAEDTRRARARDAEPVKVPHLAAQLCARFAQERPRSETHAKNRGANGARMAVRIYSLLMKVFWNCSCEQLRQRLSEVGTLWELGLLKTDVPRKNALCRWFGNPDLTPILWRMFVATTKPTRRFDTMIVGDSHDIPTRMVDNSRDRKFGPQPAKYRNAQAPLVRQHFVIGKVSGIIYGADTTLRNGPGTADAPHLESLLVQSKERTERVNVAAFDKAYGGKHNFAVAENLGIDLFVREKSLEDRRGPDWPASAQRLSRLQRSQPAEYDETIRFRALGENPPSRVKARNPYMRLRRRKGDPAPIFPDVPKGQQIWDLPREIQDAIFDAATHAVGVARLNESLAILILANLRALNMLEHLYDQEVTFEQDVTINPPIEARERDLYEVA